VFKTFTETLGMSHFGGKYPFNSSVLAEFPRLGNGKSVLYSDLQIQITISCHLAKMDTQAAPHERYVSAHYY
jgi:hypothetical protein